MSGVTFFGITGPSGSGKSLLTKTILQELIEEVGAEDIAVIAEDRYYRAQDHLSPADREATNYDHPDALEHELLVEHMDQLAAGQAVNLPQYDYVTHTRRRDVTPLSPKKVVIVEGLLLLADPEIRQRLSASVYIEAPLDVCLIRRLRRDCEERGRSMTSVLDQYEATVQQMYTEFVEPSKRHASIIVTGGGKNRFAIDVLKARLLQHLTRGPGLPAEDPGSACSEEAASSPSVGVAAVLGRRVAR